jgi:hypothetical protein
MPGGAAQRCLGDDCVHLAFDEEPAPAWCSEPKDCVVGRPCLS